LSLIENHEAPLEVLAELHRRSGRAHILGITGSPGAGKSTLVDRLVGALRDEGNRVGVIAVDPTSPFTGGAILGDRIRMDSRALDPEVFIRSMGSRGALGGLAATTQDAAKVLDAMGKDVVIIETVGVGQGEVDIVKAADTIAVVLVPGMGDEVQTFKAGIMEIGDVFCVNKGDREGTSRTMAEIAALLEVTPHEPGAWVPPIVRTIASTGEGVDDLLQAIQGHRAHLQRSGELAKRRRRRGEAELLEVLKARLVHYVLDEDGLRGRFDRYVEEIAAHRRSPHEAAAEILHEAPLARGPVRRER
jgi:LAO/AO transport system kinase